MGNNEKRMVPTIRKILKIKIILTKKLKFKIKYLVSQRSAVRLQLFLQFVDIQLKSLNVILQQMVLLVLI